MHLLNTSVGARDLAIRLRAEGFERSDYAVEAQFYRLNVIEPEELAELRLLRKRLDGSVMAASRPYPALNALLERGWLEAVRPQRYKITEAGLAAWEQWSQEHGRDDL